MFYVSVGYSGVLTGSRPGVAQLRTYRKTLNFFCSFLPALHLKYGSVEKSFRIPALKFVHPWVRLYWIDRKIGRDSEGSGLTLIFLERLAEPGETTKTIGIPLKFERSTYRVWACSGPQRNWGGLVGRSNRFTCSVTPRSHAVHCLSVRSSPTLNWAGPVRREFAPVLLLQNL
jgi:hypothetical protein